MAKEKTEIGDVITFIVASREAVTHDELAEAIFGLKPRKSAVARIKRECNALVRSGFLARHRNSDRHLYPGHKALCFLALRGGYVEAVVESPI